MMTKQNTAELTRDLLIDVLKLYCEFNRLNYEAFELLMDLQEEKDKLYGKSDRTN